MQVFLVAILTVVLTTQLFFIDFGGQQASNLQDRYKKAIDAGTDAAAKHIAYTTAEHLEKLSIGFGEGMEHSNNINIDKNDSLKWFYEVFFANLGYSNNLEMQNKLKKYIPIKAIIGFDRIYIADKNDNWIAEEEYLIEHNGVTRKFTLSDQVFYNGQWKKDTAWGIPTETRIRLVNKFINDTLNKHINQQKSNNNENYTFRLGLDNSDYKFSLVEGSNFVVFVEGIPLPTYDLSKNNKFYAFSLGGSEITRKK